MITYIILIITILVISYLVINIFRYKTSYNSIKITNGLNKATKLMIIAHPDDETLWGYRYIKDFPNEWKIISLTCANNKVRSNEFINVMNKLGINNYEIWNHDDDMFGFKMDENCIKDIINELATHNYDLIMTHNLYGEYGNLQHMAIHHALKQIKNKYNYPINYFKINKYYYPDKKADVLKLYVSQNVIINNLRTIHPFY